MIQSYKERDNRDQEKAKINEQCCIRMKMQNDGDVGAGGEGGGHHSGKKRTLSGSEHLGSMGSESLR